MNHAVLSIGAMDEEFPGNSSQIYMDVANQGLISRTTRTSIDPHLANRLRGRNDEAAMLEVVERTRACFAELIGADAAEICVAKNASEGLNIIANAVEWTPGDNIVLCPKLEHVNNILPWLRVKERWNVELRFIEPLDGHMPVEPMIRAVDCRTRVVALSTATLVPGFLCDLQRLSTICCRAGAFLLADASQSVGILHTDVQALGLDGLVVSTVKGLMGLYGLGFLYCRRSWADRLKPAYVARFSVDLGDLPESAPMPPEFSLRPGAARFDIGHYNFPAIAAAHSSMGQLLAIGTTAIDAHVRRLSAKLNAGLLDLGIPVCGGPAGAHLGSIVSVGDVRSLIDPAIDTGPVLSLHNYLTARGVIASIRRGMLRFSLHHYNTDEDVERVVGFARSWSN